MCPDTTNPDPVITGFALAIPRKHGEKSISLQLLANGDDDAIMPMNTGDSGLLCGGSFVLRNQQAEGSSPFVSIL